MTFGISFDRVNWLGLAASLMYMAIAPIVPFFISRYGLRTVVRPAHFVIALLYGSLDTASGYSL